MGATETYETRVVTPGEAVEVMRMPGEDKLFDLYADPSAGTISIKPNASAFEHGESDTSGLPVQCAHALRDGLSQVIDWLEGERSG